MFPGYSGPANNSQQAEPTEETPPISGGSPEAATLEEEQAPPLASIRIEPREITDEFLEDHRANVLAEIERNVRLEVLGFLEAHIPATGEPNMEWLTFRAGFNWRRMGGDERQDFRTWCEAIGYIPGLGGYGFLADDERWQAFLEECVTGSPIDYPPTVDPDDPDNYNSRWNRNPSPAPEKGRGLGVGNLVILFTSIGSPNHSTSTAEITPTPLLGFSGPGTLRVGGTVYGLEETPDGWDLCKPDGTSYRLAMGPHGPSCECGDFTHRRAGLDSLGCKHIRAAREAGLIPRDNAMETAELLDKHGIKPVCGGSEEATCDPPEETETKVESESFYVIVIRGDKMERRQYFKADRYSAYNGRLQTDWYVECARKWKTADGAAGALKKMRDRGVIRDRDNAIVCLYTKTITRSETLKFLNG
jgi:hypothetical protein